jgi:predicted dienelactone hydrolase
MERVAPRTGRSHGRVPWAARPLVVLPHGLGSAADVRRADHGYLDGRLDIPDS